MSSRAALLEQFRTRLGVTPTRIQLELFSADLARSSHELMGATLKELEHRVSRDAPCANLRDLVIDTYRRKLAEQARLFPVFFLFETAFRSYSVARLESIYQTDEWWRPIHTALSVGTDVRKIKSLNGVNVSRATIRTVEHILTGPGGGGLRQVASGYDLVASGTMAHVGQFIDQHWGHMVAALNPKHKSRPQGRLTSQEFTGLFNRVRNARNDLFHHRSVSGQGRVIEIIEELLDLLDIHLGDTYRKIAASNVMPLGFKILIEPRHG